MIPTFLCSHIWFRVAILPHKCLREQIVALACNFVRILRLPPLRGYIIFYRVIPDGIEILRVISGQQDLEALFDD